MGTLVIFATSYSLRVRVVDNTPARFAVSNVSRNAADCSGDGNNLTCTVNFIRWPIEPDQWGRCLK